MTHTLIRMGEKRYEVGQWLINKEGHHQWFKLFTLPSIGQAMNAVCMLNGGSRTAAGALHIKEEIDGE
jgi:hypothetical protein